MNRIILKENDIKRIVSETLSFILLREVYKKSKGNKINENAYAENLDNEYYDVDFDEVGKLRNDLYNIAYSFTKNEAEADDLTQNTILRAFEKSKLFKDGTNLMGWLRTIMSNLFKRSKTNSHAKKMSYIDDYTPYEKNDSDEIETDNIANDNAFQEKDYNEIKQELYKLVDDFAAKKGKVYRQIFDLKMQGKTDQEISQTVNLGYNRTKYILRTIRRILRENGFEKELKNVATSK